jgi:hypothetical protein
MCWVVFAIKVYLCSYTEEPREQVIMLVTLVAAAAAAGCEERRGFFCTAAASQHQQQRAVHHMILHGLNMHYNWLLVHSAGVTCDLVVYSTTCVTPSLHLTPGAAVSALC